MEGDESDQPRSKFNSAIAKLMRIDQAKKEAMNARISNDFSKWFKCVSICRGELNGKMKKEERVKCDTYEELIEDALRPQRNYDIATPYIKKRIPIIDYSIVKKLLIKYEMFIVDIEEKKGIGLIDDDDDGL